MFAARGAGAAAGRGRGREPRRGRGRGRGGLGLLGAPGRARQLRRRAGSSGLLGALVSGVRRRSGPAERGARGLCPHAFPAPQPAGGERPLAPQTRAGRGRPGRANSRAHRAPRCPASARQDLSFWLILGTPDRFPAHSPPPHSFGQIKLVIKSARGDCVDLLKGHWCEMLGWTPAHVGRLGAVPCTTTTAPGYSDSGCCLQFKPREGTPGC